MRVIPAGGLRRRRVLSGGAAILAAAGIALGLGACGNDGLSLARQACVKVDASLELYHHSAHATDPATAAREQRQATVDLEEALPLAAQANSADPQWNPLMTTLQEVGLNSEAHLISALRAQCAQAARPNEQAPVVPPPPGATGTPAGGGGSPSTLPGQ